MLNPLVKLPHRYLLRSAAINALQCSRCDCEPCPLEPIYKSTDAFFKWHGRLPAEQLASFSRISISKWHVTGLFLLRANERRSPGHPLEQSHQFTQLYRCRAPEIQDLVP